MAIIYTYPEESPITGKELVVVSSDNDEKSTRNVTLQEIANINGTNPGVSRVYFADSLGLSPSTSEAGADPTAGTGLVQVTGTVLAIGGGTGKDSTALTAATVGDVLVVNSNKDGFDFSSAASGETYDFNSRQNPTTAANVDLELTSSSGTVNTVTLVPGDSGNVTLTANDTTPPTITIESAGGTGSTYQGGNGISIDTTTTPDTLNVLLGSSSGLGFNDSSSGTELVTNLAPQNLATTSSTTNNGYVLTFDGGTGMSWLAQAFNPAQQIVNANLGLIYINQSSSFEAALHTGIQDLKGEVIFLQTQSGSDTKTTVTFELSFKVATTSTLRQTTGYHLGIGIDTGENTVTPILKSNGIKYDACGSIGKASIVTSSNALATSGDFGVTLDSCLAPAKNDPDSESNTRWLQANGFCSSTGQSDNPAEEYIWIGSRLNTNSLRYKLPGGQQWINSSVGTSDTVFISGTFSGYGKLQ
tara:strand:- start:1613 stop:3031 length:1419 start_codon:yes stop_codon:yes gene_type:complete